MDLTWHDPQRNEVTRWWTIDSRTGEPDGAEYTDPSLGHWLGESVLDDAGMVGDQISTTFVTRHFTDAEVSALLLPGVVPPAFRGGAEEIEELLGMVESLWTLAEQCYRQAWGHIPSEVERHWLAACAAAALRARGERADS